MASQTNETTFGSEEPQVNGHMRKSSVFGRTTRSSSVVLLGNQDLQRHKRSAKTLLRPEGTIGPYQYRTLSRGEDDSGEPSNGGTCRERIKEPCDNILNLIVFINLIVLVLETSLPNVTLWNPVEYILWFFYLLGFFGKVCLKFSCPNHRQRSADVNVADNNLPTRSGSNMSIAQERAKQAMAKVDCWDVFDLFIVVFGVLDLLVFYYHLGHHFKVEWHERLLADCIQVFKVLRLARLFRLTKRPKKDDPEWIRWLVVHWKGAYLGAYAMCSISVLLIVILIICAMFLVLTVGQVAEDDPDHEIFHDRMGNLWSALVTLFQLMVDPNFVEFNSLLESWPPRPIFTLFLFFFIMLGNFGVLTVLNGVVAQEITEYNEEAQVLYQNRQKAEWEVKLKEITKEAGDVIFGPDRYSAPLQYVEEKRSTLEEIFANNGLHYARDDLDTMLSMLNVTNAGEGVEDTVEKADFDYFVKQLVLGMRPMLAMEHFYETVTTKKKLARLEWQYSDLSGKIDQILNLLQVQFGSREQEEAESTTLEGKILSGH